MAPGDLQEVLAGLRPAGRATPPDLLVGLGAADDAAVYRITPDIAIVETPDFFPPGVDDPWTWGAAAAAPRGRGGGARGGRDRGGGGEDAEADPRRVRGGGRPRRARGHRHHGLRVP